MLLIRSRQGGPNDNERWATNVFVTDQMHNIREFHLGGHRLEWRSSVAGTSLLAVRDTLVVVMIDQPNVCDKRAGQISELDTFHNKATTMQYISFT
jgi:hypothetical protein